MGTFGSSFLPRAFAGGASVPAFPVTGSGTWTDASGAITIPAGALAAWFMRRALHASQRVEVVTFGDSTTYGSGALYSWLSRIRLRSTAAGYTDGGKGIFGAGENVGGAIIYDSPEVNGFVSTTFSGSGDGNDTLEGQYWWSGTSAGETLNLQFRSTCLRIWYVKRGGAGSFSYAIDGGSATTVNAAQQATTDNFAWVSGLSTNTTHTLTITSQGGGNTIVAAAPVNDTGIVWSKQATSGDTFAATFHGPFQGTAITGTHTATRYQAPLGLVPTSAWGSPTSTDGYAANNVIDTGYVPAARVSPALAMVDLGFNDLTAQANTDYSVYTEGIKKFAAACRAAGCSGLVLSGQLPYNANWTTYGPAIFAAVKAQAIALGLGFVDLFYPVAGSSLSYSGGVSQPHLTKTQYEAQGDFLWDNLLSL